MKKLGGFLLIGAFVLSGCAVTPEPVPTVSAPTYLQTVRDSKVFFGYSDERINDVGQLYCDNLQGGATYNETVELLQFVESGISRDQAETVIYAMAAEFCPEQAG
jgi:hypothetical protein